MKITIDQIEEKGVGENNDKNIQIRISGEDIKFIATEYSLSVFIDEDEADKLSFQIGSVLQEIERRKTEGK